MIFIKPQKDDPFTKEKKMTKLQKILQKHILSLSAILASSGINLNEEYVDSDFDDFEYAAASFNAFNDPTQVYTLKLFEDLAIIELDLMVDSCVVFAEKTNYSDIPALASNIINARNQGYPDSKSLSLDF